MLQFAQPMKIIFIEKEISSHLEPYYFEIDLDIYAQ